MMLVEVGFVTYCPVEIYVLLKSAPSHCGVEYVLQYPLHRAGSDLVYALICVVPLSLVLVISLFLEIGYVLLLQDCTQVNCKEERPICMMYCLLVLVIVCYLVK